MAVTHIALTKVITAVGSQLIEDLSSSAKVKRPGLTVNMQHVTAQGHCAHGYCAVGEDRMSPTQHTYINVFKSKKASVHL